MCYVVFGVVCLVCSGVVFLSCEKTGRRRLNVEQWFIKHICGFHGKKSNLFLL